MAIIIERGHKLDLQKELVGIDLECGRCGCKFQTEAKDSERVSLFKQDNMEFIRFSCPQCSALTDSETIQTAHGIPDGEAKVA
jgi:transcription elongation factor Elf1